MRHALAFLALASVTVLSSCAPMRVSGIYTYGHIHAVDRADIEAAIAYCYAHSHIGAKIRFIQIVSHDEIRLYGGEFDGSYAILKRVGKKWVSGGTVIVTS